MRFFSTLTTVNNPHGCEVLVQVGDVSASRVCSHPNFEDTKVDTHVLPE